ncbi:hypothetical protein [Flavobacterium notoginsengisoli]|uniref:hypothetical protein n=1 Tax=Flavobacterium notoginsengisoli TaxID=1478199 RepID=UPI0036323399
MKKIILFLFIFSMSHFINAQDTITSPIKKELAQKQDLIKSTPKGYEKGYANCDQDATELEVLLVIGKKGDKPLDKNQYKLKQIGGSAVVDASSAEGIKLTFKIPNPLQSVEDVVFYQLTNKNQTTFYQYIKQISKQSMVAKPVTINALTLSVYTPQADVCTGCKTVGNTVSYYFGTNETKITRKAGSNIKPSGMDSEGYLRTRWWALPHVGEELELEILDVNPFKYDVTISDETVNIHSSTSEFLTSVFTPGIPKMSGADKGTQEDQERIKFSKIMESLDQALTQRMAEYQREGDCYNPCSDVSKADNEIQQYFINEYTFPQGTITLESFLLQKIENLYGASDGDEEATKEKKKLKDVVSKYISFKTSAMGRVSYSIPQIKNVDQYVFTVNITPKPNMNAGKRLTNAPITVDILGGFRADVTTGLFGTSLVDEKYRIFADSTQVPGSSPTAYIKRKKIVKEDWGNKDYGVSALFHFYYKFNPYINPSLSLGAGMTISDKPKLRYFLGGSLLFGKTNRLAITYGAAMGQIEELSDRYVEDPDGNIYTSNSDTTVDLKKRFQIKPFLSLTYSIPVFEKKEKVKAAEVKEEEVKTDTKKK